VPATHRTEKPLTPELETLATAAADQLHAELDGDHTTREDVRRRVADAASAAIAAGVPLAAIADGERAGQQRARRELGPTVLQRLARAAARKREAETEHEQKVRRAARLGLSNREIATAASVSHGTIRAIITPQRQRLAPAAARRTHTRQRPRNNHLDQPVSTEPASRERRQPRARPGCP
jgi:DNA-binding NarL/FixJ family response regulator